MNIWRHCDFLSVNESSIGLHGLVCPFCSSILAEIGETTGYVKRKHITGKAMACQLCGWWNFTSVYTLEWRGFLDDYLNTDVETRYLHGSLKNFQVNVYQKSSPIDEIRRYLLAHNESLNFIHPRHLEEVVDDIYLRSGYKSKLTPRSKDGGIDIFLYSDCNENIAGVEIKRWANKVGVYELRAFLTSLKIADLNKGVFLATNGFTSGAKEIVSMAPSKGLAKVTLLDSDWLFERLKITQVPAYKCIHDLDESVLTLLKNFEHLPVAEEYTDSEDDSPTFAC